MDQVSPDARPKGDVLLGVRLARRRREPGRRDQELHRAATMPSVARAPGQLQHRWNEDRDRCVACGLRRTKRGNDWKYSLGDAAWCGRLPGCVPGMGAAAHHPARHIWFYAQNDPPGQERCRFCPLWRRDHRKRSGSEYSTDGGATWQRLDLVPPPPERRI
jgi:hypothetical protein